MLCSRCGTQLPDVANFCSHCGQPVPIAPQFQGVPTSTPVVGAVTPDATGGIIPYRNAPALIGYYCGVFSLIPLLGLPLGIAAIPLGVMGLRKQRREPVVRGKVHAWVAIALGSFSIIAWGGLLVFLVISVNKT